MPRVIVRADCEKLHKQYGQIPLAKLLEDYTGQCLAEIVSSERYRAQSSEAMESIRARMELTAGRLLGDECPDEIRTLPVADTCLIQYYDIYPQTRPNSALYAMCSLVEKRVQAVLLVPNGSGQDEAVERLHSNPETTASICASCALPRVASCPAFAHDLPVKRRSRGKRRKGQGKRTTEPGRGETRPTDPPQDTDDGQSGGEQDEASP